MASGDTLAVFTPLHSEPPAANYARLDTRNDRPTLDFKDSATNETTIFTYIMPRHYAGTTGVTLYIHYAMTTAISGDIDWDAAFERVAANDLDIDSDGFAAVQSTDGSTVPDGSGKVAIVAIPFTDGAQMDSVVSGDMFRLLVRRDGASDTASGDAELLTVELKET